MRQNGNRAQAYQCFPLSRAPVRRTTLSQSIAQSILERVARRELGVGDRLPTEAGLMAEFGVGRNVVREAIQQLVAIGVVDVRPRRGAIVQAIPAESALDNRTVYALLEDQTIDDLYAFRRLIEAEIAARAAERADADGLNAIAEKHEHYRRLLAAGQPVFMADVAFHRSIAVASGNEVYVRVLDELADILEAAREETDHVHGAPERGLADHGAILEAIAQRDAKAARSLAEEHIRTALLAIRRSMEPHDEGGRV
jgi:GntR family transcriptional regulator, transcriptional repressor for pyruvate dehydrogenase complex